MNEFDPSRGLEYGDPWCDASYWMDALAEPCFVYVARCGTAIKFGKATNVYERIDGHQCGNPVAITLLCVLPGGYELETRFHRWLRDECVRGEWFEGPETEKALKFASQLRDQIVEAYDGGDTAPDWRGLMTWPRIALNLTYRKRRKPAPVTVRRVEPFPLSPEERDAFEAARAYEADLERQRRDRIRRADPHLA